MIDDPDSSEVAAYLKKILKSNGRRTTENYVNGSDSTTPRSSSVPDLLVGVDVSSIEKNKRGSKKQCFAGFQKRYNKWKIEFLTDSLNFSNFRLEIARNGILDVTKWYYMEL